jgi:putative radical SAM enzyme (TIGR03279 family)
MEDVMKKIKIYSIAMGSIAQELGIDAGDFLLKINNEEIGDVFDYRFLTADENIIVEIEKANGEIIEYEIEKDEYEDLGLEFENDLIEDARTCSNNCIFCFIDQLPKNMRQSLYFKDDDSRLSFLTGNYVTLTNITDEQLKKIIKYKLSPINISVHAVNPKIRVKMLRNKNAADIVEKIQRLTDAGIEVNCQIVLCHGINDRQELDNTIGTLGNLYPKVKSVSIVPVGLTEHRNTLYPLEKFNNELASEVIKQVKNWQHLFLETKGSRISYLADEFYILANMDIPAYEEYEDFPQIENGVGLIAAFEREVEDFLEDVDEGYFNNFSDTISIATGVSAYETIYTVTSELENKCAGLKIKVYPVINKFFGDLVTVTGLITGQDIIKQLKDKPLGSRLLICRSMLRANTEVFLDDYTVDDIEKSLNIKVQIVENIGEDFVKKALNKNGDGRC